VSTIYMNCYYQMHPHTRYWHITPKTVNICFMTQSPQGWLIHTPSLLPSLPETATTSFVSGAQNYTRWTDRIQETKRERERERGGKHSITSSSQLVRNVMVRRATTCTHRAHTIPNHKPYIKKVTNFRLVHTHWQNNICFNLCSTIVLLFIYVSLLVLLIMWAAFADPRAPHMQ